MSDHGTPFGPGSSPSGPTPTGSAGKAATIPRADQGLGLAFVETMLVGFFDLSQRHRRAGIPQREVEISGQPAPDGHWLHPLTLYWLPEWYRDLPPAQAIEARQGRDVGSACESPVGRLSDAPDQSPHRTQDHNTGGEDV